MLIQTISVKFENILHDTAHQVTQYSLERRRPMEKQEVFSGEIKVIGDGEDCEVIIADELIQELMTWDLPVFCFPDVAQKYHQNYKSELIKGLQLCHAEKRPVFEISITQMGDSFGLVGVH